jgi:RepB DNA-primase from phage plasmid/AAA domain
MSAPTATEYLAQIKSIQATLAGRPQDTLPEKTQTAAVAKPIGDKPDFTDSDQYIEYYEYVTAIGRPGDTLCFLAIDHKNDKRENEFVSFEKAATRAYFHELQRANTVASIYLATNTFPSALIGSKTGRTQENVVEVRAVQADVDQNAAVTMDAIKSSTSVPQPSIIVESSPGKFQGIWLVDGFQKDEAKPLMQAMAAEFQTDSAVADIARVMRVPGFVNRKYEAAPIAKTVSQTNARYTRDQFKLTIPESKFESKTENWVNDVVITHGNAYNDLLKLAGYYVRVKNINDPEMLYKLLAGHCEHAVDRDGKTPWQPNMRQVRGYADKWAAEFETGKEIEARTTHLVPNIQPTSSDIKPETVDKQPIVITAGDQFLSEKIPPRKVLVSTISGGEPVIFEQSINQIFAWRGVGKTCLGLGFVRALATGGYFLNFRAMERVHTLYVEGELPDSQFQERWRSIVGKTDGFAHLASVDKQPGHHFVSLATDEGMARVEAALMELQKKGIHVKALLLDNISTLFNVAANDEEVWIRIQAWLMSLRSRGLTVFFFHHAGKGGLSRSHSKSEDMLDVSIKLEEPDEAESGHLHALMTFDKARAGLSERAAEIKLHRTHSPNCQCEGKQTLSFCPGDGVRWEHIPKMDKKAEAYELFATGAKVEQVATMIDKPLGTVKMWRTNWGRQRMNEAVKQS